MRAIVLCLCFAFGWTILSSVVVSCTDANTVDLKPQGKFEFVDHIPAARPIDAKPCECKGETPCQCEKCECVKVAKTVPQNRMLFFTATWCGPCQIWKQQEKPRLEAVGWTINGSESADIQVVDYDINTAKAQEYGVTSLPTFVMVRPDGSEIVRYGYIDANQAADIWNENQPEGE